MSGSTPDAPEPLRLSASRVKEPQRDGSRLGVPPSLVDSSALTYAHPVADQEPGRNRESEQKLDQEPKSAVVGLGRRIARTHPRLPQEHRQSPNSFYNNHMDHPADYTALCVLALLKHIEQIEVRVEILEKEQVMRP